MVQLSFNEWRNLQMKHNICTHMQCGVNEVEINVAVRKNTPDLWAFAFYGNYKPETDKNGLEGYRIKSKKSNLGYAGIFMPLEQHWEPVESRFWKTHNLSNLFVSASQFEIKKQIIKREPVSKRQQFLYWINQ